MELIKNKVCHLLQRNGERIESVGSAVILHFAKNRVGLLSAEHVFKEKNICIPTKESYEQTPFYSLLEGKRCSSDIGDWAFVISDEKFYHSLKEAGYEESSIGSPMGICIFAGFPISRNKTKKTLVQNRPYSYSALELSDSEYINYSIDKSICIAVHYDKKNTIDRDSGASIQFPDPHGMSGGGIFNIKGELIGVITNQSEDGRIFYGLRTTCILTEQLHGKYELRDMIVDLS